ncbi:MAG: hypothetical protein AABM42_10635 [Actinomycetota bacterium]
MKDPEASASEYDPLQYWREPDSFAAKRLTPAYWSDPWPNLQGMLTSEYIRAYHEAVGRMIRPFDPERLKTASYELTLGARHVVEKKERRITPEEPRLVLPPNSLSFVSTEQVLLLPHYLVGRFDLAIDFIYQGLLLGTGPQVDPGFQGGLSCPLHNISNEEIVLELGKPFAKIDFAKTVPRPERVRAAWDGLSTEKELRRWLEDEPASSSSRLFKGGRPKWREPIFDYLGAKRPTSSVKALQARLDRYRTFGWSALALGVIALLVGVPSLILQATDLFNNDLAPKETVTKLEQQTAAHDHVLQARIEHLEGAVRSLQKQSSGAKP